MPKVSYSSSERERIRTSLIETGLRLISKQGVQHTTIEQIYKEVGISRTFFYSFFSSKEELVVACLYDQQPKVISYIKALRKDPSLDWKQAFRIFLKRCCYGKESFVILSIEEQQLVFKRLTNEKYTMFRQKQERLFSEILINFDIEPTKEQTALFINLCLMLIVFRKAIPASLPLFIPEVADQSVEYQIESMISYLETCKKKNT